MLVVYHYYRFKLSQDDVVELMAIGGIHLSHKTVHKCFTNTCRRVFDLPVFFPLMDMKIQNMLTNIHSRINAETRLFFVAIRTHPCQIRARNPFDCSGL